MKRTQTRAFRLVLGLGALFFSWAVVSRPAASSDGAEFKCEEAAAHLKDCCPGFDPGQLNCSYLFGCGEDDTPDTPQITPDESNCLQQQSCDELRSNGNCKVAQNGGSFQCR